MKSPSFATIVSALLALTSIATTGSPLRIYPAIELEFPTQSERHYQIEASADLHNWAPFGSLIVGSGMDINLLVSTKGTALRFFRLIEVDLSDGLVARYRFDGNVT